MLLLLVFCPKTQILLVLSHLSSHDAICPCSRHGVAGWVLKRQPGSAVCGLESVVLEREVVQIPTVNKPVSPGDQALRPPSVSPGSSTETDP